MTAERRTHRVIKTLAPTDRGAIELARRHGEALVCVRYRTDGRGKIRYTTVELVVNAQPIRPRTVKKVLIRVAAHERSLNAMIRAAGGQWDAKTGLWRLPSRVATILNLRDRVVTL